MKKAFLLFQYICISLIITVPIKLDGTCITIKECITRIYTKHKKLPPMHEKHIRDILEPFQDSSGTIKINSKIRSKIWWVTKTLTCKFDKQHIKHQAAYLVHILIQDLKKDKAEEDKKLHTEQKEICTICLEAINKESMELACTHRFCQQCILQWMEISTNNDCPLCRKPID